MSKKIKIFVFTKHKNESMTWLVPIETTENGEPKPVTLPDDREYLLSLIEEKGKANLAFFREAELTIDLTL